MVNENTCLIPFFKRKPHQFRHGRNAKRDNIKYCQRDSNYFKVMIVITVFVVLTPFFILCSSTSYRETGLSGKQNSVHSGPLTVH